MEFQWLTPIRAASWKDETVIYHCRSGDTFLFSEPVSGLLAHCMAAARFSRRELLALNCEAFQDRRQAEDYIDSMLRNLLRRDLIVPVARED